MKSLEKGWYEKAYWLYLLWPVSMLFRVVVIGRRFVLQRSARPLSRQPVIVVGNINIGGMGKTPFVIWLVQKLRKAGFRPGVISRGYGSKASGFPLHVSADTDVREAGDEASVIVRNCDCPLVIDPDRPAALRSLVKKEDVDVVISDDGLQHYALHRDMEVVIVDGQRMFGNRMLMPAGPLREPVSRVNSVDYVVVNGDAADISGLPRGAVTMKLEPLFLINLISGERKPFRGAPFNIGTRIHAVSGIGNPQRFFDALQQLPFHVETHGFPDHHEFTVEDFAQLDIPESETIVMTEKDAVKCLDFARPNFWYVSVAVKLPTGFETQLLSQIGDLIKQSRLNRDK
ncbi:MAG: tetraacyldisaccharide 4'-kinase [Pseudohongiellaceae bacterium]